MPSPEKRVRVERGLYKTGNHYYACDRAARLAEGL